MDRLDPLKIGGPTFIGFIVGMTDMMPYLVAFTADATYLGHGYSFHPIQFRVTGWELRV
jgi:hypothetical protein